MKPKQALFGIIAAGCLLAATQTQAAAYLKLGDIKGEATDADHKEWIDVLSIDWGVKLEPDAPGSTRMVPKPKPVSCTKELDKASPKIMQAITTGQAIPLVEIHLTTDGATGRQVYYKYELTNVRVTSFNTGGNASGDPLPSEEISLNFEQIKVTYTEYDSQGQSTGDTVATWDLREGTAQ